MICNGTTSTVLVTYSVVLDWGGECFGLFRVVLGHMGSVCGGVQLGGAQVVLIGYGGLGSAVVWG